MFKVLNEYWRTKNNMNYPCPLWNKTLKTRYFLAQIMDPKHNSTRPPHHLVPSDWKVSQNAERCCIGWISGRGEVYKTCATANQTICRTTRFKYVQVKSTMQLCSYAVTQLCSYAVTQNFIQLSSKASMQLCSYAALDAERGRSPLPADILYISIAACHTALLLMSTII